MEGYLSRFTSKLSGDVLANARPALFYAGAGSEDSISEIRAKLDSKFEQDKLDALKRIVNEIVSKNRDMSELFPDIVKNVTSTSPQIRHLVLVCISKYAEKEPDLALLAVNTFQKELSDKNPLVRYNALRAMSAIKVPVIAPISMWKDLLSHVNFTTVTFVEIAARHGIAVLAIRKALTDLSPHVRRGALHAIPKCYACVSSTSVRTRSALNVCPRASDGPRLDTSQQSLLLEILLPPLYSDAHPLVAAAALHALRVLSPGRLDLLHPAYRRLCRMVPDMDEWSQVEVIEILARYARGQFADPDGTAGVVTEEAFVERPDSTTPLASTLPSHLDPDYRLLLITTHPLLRSRNPAVSLSTLSLHLALLPRSHTSLLARPALDLVRACRSSREHLVLALRACVELANRAPGAFKGYHGAFYVYPLEAEQVWRCKLRMLVESSHEECAGEVVEEVGWYVRGGDRLLAKEAVAVLGEIATKLPSVADRVIAKLMDIVAFRDDEIAASSIDTLRPLLSLHPSASHIRRLASLLEGDTSAGRTPLQDPSACSSVLWLVGEYSHLVPRTAPDVLRVWSKDFEALGRGGVARAAEGDHMGILPPEDDEDEELSDKERQAARMLKLQVLNLAAKLAVANFMGRPTIAPAGDTGTVEEPINDDERTRVRVQVGLLFEYVTEMARYDTDYDVRDRGRLLKSLIMNKIADQTDGEANGTGVVEGGKIGETLSERLADIMFRNRGVKSRMSSGAPPAPTKIYPLSSFALLSTAVRDLDPLGDFPGIPPEPSLRSAKSEDPWARDTSGEPQYSTQAPSPGHGRRAVIGGKSAPASGTTEVKAKSSMVGSRLSESSTTWNGSATTAKTPVDLDAWFEDDIAPLESVTSEEDETETEDETDDEENNPDDSGEDESQEDSEEDEERGETELLQNLERR
ncbi:AP-3 complex subunit beta-2 [Gonapodya sp. JEL0774]|nr:AP-3 complex subunit beta-2 [Gonapodya sp. JEL0774]